MTLRIRLVAFSPIVTLVFLAVLGAALGIRSSNSGSGDSYDLRPALERLRASGTVTFEVTLHGPPTYHQQGVVDFAGGAFETKVIQGFDRVEMTRLANGSSYLRMDTADEGRSCWIQMPTDVAAQNAGNDRGPGSRTDPLPWPLASLFQVVPEATRRGREVAARIGAFETFDLLGMPHTALPEWAASFGARTFPITIHLESEKADADIVGATVDGSRVVHSAGDAFDPLYADGYSALRSELTLTDPGAPVAIKPPEAGTIATDHPQSCPALR